jgi:uncharacterized protein YybS (DUF2232 family)
VLFWAITQQVVVILYRRFSTTYRSHLQGSRIEKKEDSVVLMYFAAEVGNHAQHSSMGRIIYVIFICNLMFICLVLFVQI